jgi:hypothetical protein
MSAKTIPRDSSQAVGNGFLIFRKCLLRMVGDEKGKEMEEELRDLSQAGGSGTIGHCC